jgi:hypothetical protein
MPLIPNTTWLLRKCVLYCRGEQDWVPFLFRASFERTAQWSTDEGNVMREPAKDNV